MALISMHTLDLISFKNDNGDSWTVCWTRSRDEQYSSNRLNHPQKLSAFRIEPEIEVIAFLNF